MTRHRLYRDDALVYDYTDGTTPPPVDPTPPGGGGGGGGDPPIPPNTGGGVDISDGAMWRPPFQVQDDQTVSVYVNRPGLIEVVPVSGTVIHSRTDAWGTEALIGGASVSYQRNVPGGTYNFSIRSLQGLIGVIFRG